MEGQVNIEMDLQEIRPENMDCIHVTKERVHCLIHVNMAMNLRIGAYVNGWEILCLAGRLLSSQKLCFTELVINYVGTGASLNKITTDKYHLYHKSCFQTVVTSSLRMEEVNYSETLVSISRRHDVTVHKPTI
jgi:hypothetical protein